MDCHSLILAFPECEYCRQTPCAARPGEDCPAFLAAVAADMMPWQATGPSVVDYDEIEGQDEHGNTTWRARLGWDVPPGAADEFEADL